MQLRVAEQYLTEFGHLAKVGTSMVLPANLTDVASMVAMATQVIQKTGNAPDGKPFNG